MILRELVEIWNVLLVLGITGYRPTVLYTKYLYYTTFKSYADYHSDKGRLWMVGFISRVHMVNKKIKYIAGCPQKMETKTGEDITSKLGQPHPSNFRFLKAHLVEIKCVYYERNQSSAFWDTTNNARTFPEPLLPIWRKPVILLPAFVIKVALLSFITNTLLNIEPLMHETSISLL